MNKPHKSSLLIIFLVVFIDLLGFGIVLPLLPRYGDYFQADRWTLGALMASFSAMQFLFAPLWGRLSDSIGRKPVLLLGLTGSVLFYALFGYASSLEKGASMMGLRALGWMFVARIGAGIAGATISTAQAAIADSTGTHERGPGMALIGAAFGLGFTFGPLIAAPFASDDIATPPSAAPGYLASGLSAMALLAAVVLLQETLTPESRSASRKWFAMGAFRKVMQRPVIFRLLATIFLTTFAFAKFESTLALLTQELGLSRRDNFYVFAYLGFTLMVAQGFLVRRLLPKIGEHRAAIGGALVMTIGLLLIGMLAPSADDMIQAEKAPSGGLGLLFSILPISVLGYAFLTPSLQSLLSLRTSDTEQGEILGLGQSMSAMARILGPVAGIVLVKTDPRYPYWAAAGVMLLGLALVLALRQRSEQETREPEENDLTQEAAT